MIVESAKKVRRTRLPLWIFLETAPPQNNNNNNNNGEPTIVAGTKHEFNTVLILSCCDEQLHLCGGWMGVVYFGGISLVVPRGGRAAATITTARQGPYNN